MRYFALQKRRRPLILKVAPGAWPSGDLPTRVRWAQREHRGVTFYEYDGGSWLIHVAHEDEAEFRDEMIAEAFGSAPPRNAEAIALLEEVITVLEERCGGIVLPI